MLDLFAGAGGLTNGFYSASERFITERAVEFDAAAAATYTSTFGPKVYAGPIQQWLLDEPTPQVDVVIGGPPCQGFSLLGKRNENDDRNSLWQEYAEVLRRSNPKYFVVENVPAFGKSRQLQDFESAAREGGELSNYRFEWEVLNAADYGAPQARKRAILLGHRKDLPKPKFPNPTHDGRHTTVKEAFRGIPHKADSIAFIRESKIETVTKPMPGPFRTTELHLGREYRELSLQRFRAIPPGGNRMNLPRELLAPCWLNHTTGSGDVMGRLHWDRPSVTIRTEFFKPEKGRYLHPEADRAITHLEAARLQGFTDEHLWVGSKTSIARQIGNAVPRWLGEAIAKSLLENL
ncbi:DNA (cytosine-5-)-methyltransferase [Glutamicibacter soli]|uniref:DNA (cytosine-5-)-methyltransferase n=2 Tax=Glutamicibacter soli TaxID=453836 RepID=A0A6L9G7Y7_9MICC|nr:DNA (cytosine-5-)-methyltransferase [Glutamicibacter soli]